MTARSEAIERALRDIMACWGRDGNGMENLLSHRDKQLYRALTDARAALAATEGRACQHKYRKQITGYCDDCGAPSPAMDPYECLRTLPTMTTGDAPSPATGGVTKLGEFPAPRMPKIGERTWAQRKADMERKPITTVCERCGGIGSVSCPENMRGCLVLHNCPVCLGFGNAK